MRSRVRDVPRSRQICATNTELLEVMFDNLGEAIGAFMP